MRELEYRETALDGVRIIKPVIYSDSRGMFSEVYNVDQYAEATGGMVFIQQNESRSVYGVLRGLHYQAPPWEQAKLIRVVQGRILDVAVDLRKESPTYLHHVAIEIDDTLGEQVFIPRGFAHGFLTLSKQVVVNYLIDNQYAPDFERGIRYDDKQIGINWPLHDEELILSPKDLVLPTLDELKA